MTHFIPYSFNKNNRGDGVRYPVQQVPAKDYLSHGILNPKTAAMYRKKQNLGINPFASAIKPVHISFTTPSAFAQYGKGKKKGKGFTVTRKKYLLA